MADQIRNENVGEVSSPTPEEKVTAPRKAPTFAEPPKRKEPTFGSGEGKSDGNAPDKNLPKFEDEVDDSQGGKPEKKLPELRAPGSNKPERKEPVFKPKERKLPTFANEVKQHKDDEAEDDIDFTSDSITMPFSMPASAVAPTMVGADVSEVDGEEEKKGKKKKKAKKDKKSAAPIEVIDADKADAQNMDQLDELSRMGGTMPSVVPFGGEGFVDLNPNSTSYVPSYEQENAIMAKHQQRNFGETEPMPEYSPVDPGIAEANALLNDNKANKKNKKAPAKSESGGKEETPASSDSKSTESDKPEETADKAPAEAKEASGGSAPKSGKPLDPGIEEAKALLEADAAERQRVKDLKKAKREKSNAPAAVVETAETEAPEAENAQPTVAQNAASAAPLTNAEAPKKVVLLLPEDEGASDAPAVGIVAPADVEIEAYKVDDTQATPLPLNKKEIPTSAYEGKKDQASKNAELEALAVVYGSERAKQAASDAPKAKKGGENTYPDTEAYVVPVKASAKKEAAPKAPTPISTDAYDAKKQKALDKKADKDANRTKREALAVVYGEEKARELAPVKEEKPAKEAAKAVVYGDAEPYVAPVKEAPVSVDKSPKAKKEVSTAGYSASEQKKIEKQESKAEKKAEKEALLAVASAEKQKAKEDKAIAKAEKSASNQPAPTPIPVYSDSEAYNAPAWVAPVAEAKAPKAKKEISTVGYTNAEQKKIDKKEAKAEKKAEKEALLAVAAADKQKAKEDKAIAKAEKAASNQPAPTPMPVYSDAEAYNAPAWVAPVAEAKAPEAKKEISTIGYTNAEQKKIDKKEAKAEKKAEKEALLAVAAADKQKAKEDKAIAKAEKAASNQPAPAPETVYSDSDYNEGYDPSAFEKAPVQPDTSKADTKAAKEEKKNQSASAAQDKAIEKKQNKAAVAAALVAFYNGNKPVAKAAKAEEVKQASETVYPDADYDTGYDPDWAAKAEAEKAAADAARKLESKDAKAAAKSASMAQRDAKSQHKYETHEEKALREREERDELLLTYKEEIAREKAAKAAAKAAIGTPVPKAKDEVIYPEFTETFDEDQYNREKKAEADAIAAAQAEALAKRNDKRNASEAKATEKIASAYDKATGEKIAKMEKEAEMLELLKAEKMEAKALDAKAREAAKAQQKANKALKTEDDRVYPEFTEVFDEELYKADQLAQSEAANAANVAKREAMLAKDNENAAKRDYKNISAYDKAVGEKTARKEEKAEMLELVKQDNKEAKARAAEEKALEKAEKKANKALKIEDDRVYPDFEGVYSEDLEDAIETIEEGFKDDKKIVAYEKDTLKDAADTYKKDYKAIDAYNDAVGKRTDKKAEKAEMLGLVKQENKEAKAREAEKKALDKAIEKANKTLPIEDDQLYPMYTDSFDKALYDSIKVAEADAIAAKEIAEYEKHVDKDAAKKYKEDYKAIDAYTEAADKFYTAKDKKADMLAIVKQDNKDIKDRAAQQKALDKAIEKANKALPIEDDQIYPEYTETFDESLYNIDRQAQVDAKDRADIERYEKSKLDSIARKNERDIKNLASYDKLVGMNINRDAEEKEMLKLVKQDEKETREAAKKAKKLLTEDMLAALKQADSDSTLIYPDPEYLPDEFDDKFLDLTFSSAGDVVVGSTPKITTVEEIRRREQEDKELALLVKKENKALKKIKYDLETLKLADEYTESGSLVMADPKTVTKDAKLARREELDREAVKAYEKNLENEEMLYFKEDYDLRLKKNKKRLKRAEKYGKFMLEYGSTYDPEWDGDFNNYGLPEIHPFTEGVKLSKSRRRSPRKERLSYFDKKKISSLSREQCDTDNKMIESRVRYDYTELELEVSKVQHEFSGEYRTSKEKRWLRDSKAKLKNLKAKISSALKYEKLDNERYYSVVATDFERVELPAKADREELILMREELMRLLDIRDDINTQLLEIYSGTENGMRGSTKGRAKVVLRARKRAHARMVRYYKVLSKHRVTRNEKMRIFDKMDEVVDLKGQLARAKYILRKEKPVGKVKREYLKEKKDAKRDIRILKKSIERSTIKALKRARKRERQMRVMALAYFILGIIALGVLAMVVMGPQILEAFKILVPSNFHKYIDIIISKWPL